MTYEQRRLLSERLRDGGLRHYAFISYPHTDEAMKEFACKFHRRFEDLLRQSLHPLVPDQAMDRVFIDRHDVAPGAEWEANLAEALCRSVAMIALCVPMYANSDWCGREWQAMVELSGKRLPAGGNAIFPVALGELELHEKIERIEQ